MRNEDVSRTGPTHEGLKNEAYGPPSHSFPESRGEKARCILAMPPPTSVTEFKLPLERM